MQYWQMRRTHWLNRPLGISLALSTLPPVGTVYVHTGSFGKRSFTLAAESISEAGRTVHEPSGSLQGTEPNLAKRPQLV